MGRSPCCSKEGLNKGAWTALEDQILTDYIKIHGEGKWRRIPNEAGLKRCGRSCRLRWLNYLRPDIKRGNITQEEEDLIIRLHKLLGNRWSLIAGRIPGRTDNEIKNYWNTTLVKKVKGDQKRPKQHSKKKKKKNKKETNSTIVDKDMAKYMMMSSEDQLDTTTSSPSLQVEDQFMLDLDHVGKLLMSDEIPDSSDFWKLCQLGNINNGTLVDHYGTCGINNSTNSDGSRNKNCPSTSAMSMCQLQQPHHHHLLFSQEMLEDWMRDDD